MLARGHGGDVKRYSGELVVKIFALGGEGGGVLCYIRQTCC